jgi:mannan endo-1,4-beta-mannosidase
MKQRWAIAISAVLALLASLLVSVQPASAAVGLRVSGRNIVEANGSNFIIRGTSHAHTWFSTQTSSFANIKSLGANAVRVVLSGGRWPPANGAADVANVVSLCKAARLICILENHDTTGFGEQGGAVSLDAAVNYWISVQSALTGQENHVIINIGNEPIGNNVVTPGWTQATTSAITRMRSAGFQHLLMVDAPNWGQDWQFTMRDNAATVADADPQDNTVFSVHMYGVFDTAAEITAYLNAFQTAGLPLVIGEFGHNHSDGNPDEDTIMAQAVQRGIGYLGWSWSGNSGGVEYLDQVTNFNVNQLTPWGQRLFNGANGIASTAREATIYSGGSADTTPPSTPGAPSASNVTSSGATLTWAASTDAGGSGLAGYNVYREQGTTDPQLGASATNSIALTGLSASTQYQVYVRARDGAGNLSANSTAVTFTTQPGGNTGGTCTVSASAPNPWSTGYVMNVTVTNSGTTTSSGWSVPSSLPAGHAVTNVWSATMTGGTATNVAYNGRLGPGQSTSWGFQGSRPSGNTQLPTINTCTLT